MRDAMLTASWQAAAIAVVVWAITLMGDRWIAARWRCALWSIVFLRLVMPALPPSPMSVFNFRPAAAAMTRRPAVITPSPSPRDGAEVVTFGVIPDTLPPPRPLSDPVAFTPWLTIAWLAVAGVLILRMLVAAALLHVKLRGLTPTSDPRLLDLLHGTAIRAIETNIVASPALVGIIRPRLLLPVGVVDRLTPAELRFIVLHELAHVRRHDIFVSAIVAVITALHWFNPMAWLAAARYRAERELACDEAVLVATSPDGRPAYGATILRLVELISSSRSDRTPFGAAGVLSSSRRTLRRRIAAIAAGPRRHVALLGPVLILAIVMTALTGPAQTASAPAEPVRTTTTTTTTATAASTTPAADDDPRNTLTRVYDVRDLLVEIPDFNYEPDNNGFPASGPQPATTRTAARTTATAPSPDEVRRRDEVVGKLIRDITDSVDPRSWRDNGGTVGAIRELQGQLIVTQTAANQEKVLATIQARRAPRSMQIMLEARFIHGVDAEAVLKDGRWPRPAAREGHDLWPRFLTNIEVDRLLRATQAAREATIVTAPRIILHNGQRAYVMVTRQTAYVADLKPKRGGAEYDADVRLLTSGVLLDGRAQVVSDDDDDAGAKYVTLTLNPRLTTLLEMVPKSVPGTRPGQNLTIQVPHTLVTHMKATVTVPDGQTALYRIFPVREPATPLPAATQPAPDLTRPMLLLVKPTIIEAKQPEQKQFPLLSSRLDDGPTTRRAPASTESRPRPVPRANPQPLDSRP